MIIPTTTGTSATELSKGKNTLWVLPILHPARILRGGWSLAPAQRASLLRVRELLADLDAGVTPRNYLDTDTPPPNTNLNPTLDDLPRWSSTGLDEGVSIDIECAGSHLRGVGFTKLGDLSSLWVPILDQGGAQYWSYNDLRVVVEWMQGLLASPIIKVWHNGIAFDVGYLEEVGFEVAGPHLDTIMLAHTHMPEMPKKLQWLATYHLGWPSWKQLSDVDEEMEK